MYDVIFTTCNYSVSRIVCFFIRLYYNTSINYNVKNGQNSLISSIKGGGAVAERSGAVDF